MDFLLRFKNSGLRTSHHNTFKTHLQFVQHILLGYLILRGVLCKTMEFFTSSDTLLSNWKLELSFFSVMIAFWIIISFINRRLSKKKRPLPSKPIQIWQIIFDFPIVGLVIFAVITLQPRRENIDPYTPSLVESQSYFFQITLLAISCFNWYSKTILMIAFFFYTGFRTAELNTSFGRLTMVDVAANAVLAFLVFYKQEKTKRQLFVDKEKFHELSRTWMKIVNTLPEGLLILNQKGTSRFFNNSLEKTVFGSDNGDASPIIEKKKVMLLDDLVIFKDIFLAQSQESMKQSLMSMTFPQKKEEDPVYGSVANINDNDKPDKAENPGGEMNDFYRCENLGIFLRKILKKWNSSIPSQHFKDVFQNENYVLSLDAAIEPKTDSEKSFQIKIWFTNFEGQPAMIIIFSETSNSKLIHQLEDRNNYKSRLLASVSHELRTPLNGSLCLIERTIESSEVPEILKEKYLIPAFRSNKLLLHIINDILDLSQMQMSKLNLNYESKSISESILECVQLLELQAQKKKIEILAEFAIEDHLFTTDHDRIKQILLNLLSNAVKFTLKGTIKVRLEEEAKSSSGNRCLRLEVKDTGIGISEADQSKLFKAFTKLEDKTHSALNPKGVGLGLSISDSLARHLGPKKGNDGGIKVSSILGKGSSFWLILEEKVAEFTTKLTFFERAATRFNIQLEQLNNSSTKDQIQPFKCSIDTIQKNVMDTDRNPKIIFLDTLIPAEHFIDLNNHGFAFGEDRISLQFNDPNMSDRIMLPSMSPHSSFRMLPQSDNGTMRKSTKCVCPELLVIDDDSFNILAMENILGAMSLTFNYGFNGEEAISLVANRVNNPCGENCLFYKVILMDCTMPIMDGFEASRILRNKMNEGEVPWTPIIACTAMVRNDELDKALNFCMDDYCVKPITKVKIEQLLSKYF